MLATTDRPSTSAGDEPSSPPPAGTAGDARAAGPPAVPASETSGVSDDERLARAALTRACEPDDAELHALLAAHPASDVWAALRRNDDGLPAGLVSRVAARLPAVRPDRDLDRIDALGGRLLCPGDADWPARFDDLAHPPYAIWVRGQASLAALAARSVAIVGARAATAYGVHVASEFAAALSDHGWTIVSGGAYGIDGAAHRGAIAAAGRTVAVLACGLDVAYPSGHASLFARILETGLLASEWPPGCSPMRHRFLARNRAIAALTLGTVIVEAAVRSGARRTAGDASVLGRPVMAVPGPITSAMSGGCHALLREGATCVTSPAEVIEEIGPLGATTPVATSAGAPPSIQDELGPVARRVYDAVPRRRAAPVDRIAATAGLPVVDVARQLAMLYADGLVDQAGDRYRLARGGDVG